MKCHFKFSRLSTVFHLLVLLLAAEHGETLVLFVALTETVYILYLFLGDCEKGRVL